MGINAQHIFAKNTGDGFSLPLRAEHFFIVCTLILMLLPLCAMPFAYTATTTENRELAEPPQLVSEQDGFNADFLKDAGAFFEDHFAFRNNMVDANAHLHAALGTSATDQVVVGRGGWLFYGGTLESYLGTAALSNRALRNIAHNLALLQGFAQSREAQFVFAVAPNKNSLYPSYMPGNYLASKQKSNWERLVPYLEEYNVNYVDLFSALQTDDVLYYQEDTHWNNKGALIGGNAILVSLGLDTISISDSAWIERNDYVGDLAKMLYPATQGTKPAYYASGYNDTNNSEALLWQWQNGESVEDEFSQTVSKQGAEDNTSGTLVMYRDSFANALIPYFATQFNQATFTKLVPYDAAAISIEEADYCIVERAERNLDYLAHNAPIMPAPAVKLSAELPEIDTENAQTTSLEVIVDGGYTVLSGELDPALAQEANRIYIEVPKDDGITRTYEASTISTEQSDYGFIVYLPGETYLSNKTVRVICINEQQDIGIKSFQL